MPIAAQKIGQAFKNSTKKTIIYFQWFRSFLMKPCNHGFCEKDGIGQKW
jgi:hypothetical protein